MRWQCLQSYCCLPRKKRCFRPPRRKAPLHPATDFSTTQFKNIIIPAEGRKDPSVAIEFFKNRKTGRSRFTKTIHMRKTLFLLSMLVLYSMLTFAQQKVVTGKVVDHQGQPIPFATVRIKGAKGG